MKFSYLFLFLFIIGCDDFPSSVIDSDQAEIDYNYTLDLKGLNTGSYTNVCTLYWNQYNELDFQYYSLNLISNNLINIENSLVNKFVFQMNPASFEKIYFDLIADDIISDSIEIYTRPILPVKKLTAAANAESWNTTLYWENSNEDENKFEKYKILRSEMPYDNYILIGELENQSDSTFIDTLTVWGQEYFYKVETITVDNYSRSSIIKSNIFDNSLSNEININASNNLSGRINLNWNHNLQENEFYQIEIWRTNSQNIDPINDFLLATITDYQKNTLDDSYLIGDGMTWFYKLKLKDNFGNITFSEKQAGNSLP